MQVNINDRVLVKLTDVGRQIADLNGFPSMACSVDSAGYSGWQLWTLMLCFGSYLRAGDENPFEGGDIIFENR